MTNEEKKAIEKLKNTSKQCHNSKECWKNEECPDCYVEVEDIMAIDTVLNLLEKKDKEYAELLIKVNAQNLNNSIEQRKESNEQLEALHEGWKIELEEKDNRIKELEADKEIKDKMIDLMSEHLTTPIHSKKDVVEYFENLAKGECK